MLRTAVLALLMCVVPLAAPAQETQRAPEYPLPGTEDTLQRVNAASVIFERNLNTFNWIGSLFVDTTSYGTRIRLEEVYMSNVILIDATASSPEQRLQSNQQQLSLRLTRPLTRELSAAGKWSSLTYSDNKAVGLSTASVNTILGGVEYSPDPFFTITPLIGHRWDNQIDVRNRGLSYNISARTNDIDIDGYRLLGRAQYQQDRIDPRFLEQHFARFGAQKSFLGSTRDSMELGFYKNRREYYAVSGSALESRVENIFSFTNLLDYEISHNFLTSLFVNIYNRNLDKGYRPVTGGVNTPGPDTRIEEFRLDAYIQASYNNEEKGLGAWARFGHSERDELHFASGFAGGFADTLTPAALEARLREAQTTEQTKDNIARRTSLAGSLRLPLSRSDGVSLSGAASILRYDTPSEQNVEDRDELLVVLSLSSWHHISRSLDVSLALDGTLNHIVYLLKDRSANNNVNRILRFSPRTEYRPFAGLTTMNAFEVLANYTVYDFEQEAAQVKSFSYRQFGWMDSTSLDITGRIGLDFFLYLKLYDRGQLNWSAFTERRENSFVDRTYALQLRFTPTEGTLFGIGVRYFSQSRYSYKGEIQTLESFLRSFGPTCLIVWRVNKFSELAMKGWYEQRTLEGGGTRSLANMTLNINITI